MSDDWEEFMDTRDGIEHKVYHFYWDNFNLYLIKDDAGNILAGTGPKTWEELNENPGLQKERLKKLAKLTGLRDRARREKKEGRARIVVHKRKKNESIRETVLRDIKRGII